MFPLSCLKRRPIVPIPAILLAILLALVCAPAAFALIEGGEGNSPVNDPGWPKGAEPIVNHKGRVAYWVGPPLGGGQWHAECRGDAKAINDLLVKFAEIDVKVKRVVIHNGAGNSHWLNPNRKPEQAEAAKIDWVFTVWQTGSWERLRVLPTDLQRLDGDDPKKGPPAQLDIYTGGNIRYADLKLPTGLKVVDQRLEAHGFKASDGIVLEGKITDASDKQPLPGKMRLEKIDRDPKTSYRYTLAAEVATDDEGRWVLKKAPAGWYRIVITAEGFVSRVLGYGQFDDQPRWYEHNGSLSRPSPVSGRVTDPRGEPIAGVDVRIGDVALADGKRYEPAEGGTVTTDAKGNFEAKHLPAGTGSIWIHKKGYVRPGLGHGVTMPAKDIALTMVKAAQLTVSVDFSKTVKPAGYIVELEPEGGSKIGSWGGSGNIDAKNQMIFSDVPPGRYYIRGRPNPGSAKEQTEDVLVILKGGEEANVPLSAK